MRIFLVRHGETDANVNGVIQGQLVDGPLHALGRAQAEALARFLAKEHERGLHVDRVYTSPLLRARETAEAIARALERPRSIWVDGLRELSWGIFQGMRAVGPIRREMQSILERWGRGDADARAPEGERLADAWTRASSGLAPLVEGHPHDTIVLVGHGRINKIVLSQLVHGDFLHMEEFPQRNGGFTVVERDADGAWRAPLRGADAHLEGMITREERAS